MCQLKYLNKLPLNKNNLFLDRDGVINDVVIRNGKISSPRSLEEFFFFKGLDILSSKFIRENFNLIIITNQPDLERNLIDTDFIKKINEKIFNLIECNIIYICPCTKKSKCDCRKPNTGMIDSYFSEYGRGLKNYYIGDQEADLICAKKSSITFILKNYEYNKELHSESDYVIKDFIEILKIVN